MRERSIYQGLSDNDFMETVLERWDEDNNGKYFITVKAGKKIFNDNSGFTKTLTTEQYDKLAREFAFQKMNNIIAKSTFLNAMRLGIM